MGFGLVRVTAPPAEPVTLAEAKAHLKVSGSSEDALIGLRLTAAREWVEERLGRALVNQTWRFTLDEFPRDSVIRPPRPPVVSVTSLKYIDLAGAEQTIDAADYVARTDREPAEISPTYLGTFPTPRSEQGAVRLTYVAGYGAAAADVPSAIRAAILLRLGDLHAIHEETITGTIVAPTRAIASLLDPYVFRWSPPC